MYESMLLAVYLAVLAGIAIHDLRTLRAPNRVVYPAIALAALASLTLGRADAADALLGGAVAFLALLAVTLVSRGSMGLADTKVGALCGMAVGLNAVLPMLAVAFVSGGAVAASVLALRIRGRRDVVAFTPFLAAGVLASVVWFEPYLVA